MINDFKFIHKSNEYTITENSWPYLLSGMDPIFVSKMNPNLSRQEYLALYLKHDPSFVRQIRSISRRVVKILKDNYK